MMANPLIPNEVMIYALRTEYAKGSQQWEYFSDFLADCGLALPF